MTVKLCEPERCTACGACVNVCPRDALRLTAKDGEPYRVTVDEAACIDCGRCSRVCPQLHPPEKKNVARPDCYAVCASDEIRRVSSSGGVFTLLAEEVLARGGKVFGCAYGEDMMPRHVGIGSRGELGRLQKSKYTQSDTGLSMREVKASLEQGETVLYTGLPCQIAGLNAFLGKPYPNLYTMDIVCSGTAPAGIYRRYLAELERQYEKRIIGLDFRDKRNGWGCGHLVLKFADGSEANENPNPYMQALIHGYFRQGPCLDCTSGVFPRPADLTAGDFWNIERHDPGLRDPLGTGLVTINSDQGKELFEAACRRNPPRQCSEVPFEFTRHSNWFTDKRKPHENAERFAELLKKHELRRAYEMAEKGLYDICVVGNWSGYNYGAHLTQYALYQTLTDEGYSVLMLEKPDKPPYRPQQIPELFRENPYPTWALSGIYDDLWKMREINTHAGDFIVGSDQLWNYNLFGHSMAFYALQFVHGEKKKIAYATSFGDVGYDGFPSEERKEFISLLKRFDSIAVRESSGVQTCRQMGVKAEWVLDPVFLCDRQHFIKLAEKSRLKLPRHYLFAYMVHPEKRTMTLLSRIAKEKGLEVFCTTDAMRKEKTPGIRMRYVNNATAEDWLALLYHSDYVVADSFHAYAFALIFRKQVAPVYADDVYLHRVKDLSSKLGCPQPVIAAHDSSIDVKVLIRRFSIDYEQLEDKLNSEIEKCRAWLLRAIQSKKRMKIDENEENRLTQDLHIKALETEILENREELKKIRESATYRVGQTILLPVRAAIHAVRRARGDPVRQSDRPVKHKKRI